MEYDPYIDQFNLYKHLNGGKQEYDEVTDDCFKKSINDMYQRIINNPQMVDNAVLRLLTNKGLTLNTLMNHEQFNEWNKNNRTYIGDLMDYFAFEEEIETNQNEAGEYIMKYYTNITFGDMLIIKTANYLINHPSFSELMLNLKNDEILLNAETNVHLIEANSNEVSTPMDVGENYRLKIKNISIFLNWDFECNEPV